MVVRGGAALRLRFVRVEFEPQHEGRTSRFTGWRPRHALWQFGGRGGAAIGELIVGPQDAMTINDPQLKRHVERAVGLMTSLPEDLRPICGLLDAYQFFGLVEGAESSQAREALELLLSTELRSALRRWYERCGDDMNPAALEFRQRLSGLAGERFG